jgi:membrane associated rhomboid family serine protease
MPTPLLALIALAGAALYFMKPPERRRLAQALALWLKRTAQQLRDGRDAYDGLDAQLLERTPRLLITPAIVIVWSVVWLGTHMSAATDPVLAWGASYAPQTTNGEWWRLFTYAFVHDGIFQLLAATAAIVPIGMVVERLVGRIAFAGVYAVAAICAAVVSLWTTPATTAAVGSSGAMFGMLGLLIATVVYGYARAPRLPFSRLATRRIGAGVALFLVTTLLSPRLTAAADLAGAAAGLSIGFAVAGGVVERRAGALRVLAVTTALAAVAFAVALPLGGTIDARPAIARISEVETRTSADYAKAVDGYTHGRLRAKELAQLIEMSILPALAADRARIDALHGVPREQAPLVAAAREYFELRDTSWRRRVDGLRGSNMKVLRDADRAERAALDAYARIVSTQ